MPSLADFFLAMLYLLIGSIVLSCCIVIVGMAFVGLRKQWPR
jgi:hypothetical protein